jgi:hypothetical protein
MLVGAGAATALPASCLTAADGVPLPQAREVHIRIHLDEKLGPLNIDHYGVGHGGYWDEPTWLDRVSEVRALQSKLIRLFVQEYYDVLPEPGRYNWEKLDRSVGMILRAGAKPLMCLTLKPKILFPKVDQDVVNPTSWPAWEELLYNLVQHQLKRGAGISYWEVGNEGDIGAGGGCPYRFTPETYLPYYQHTVTAIRKADPAAHVGGPALAIYTSPHAPALLAFCDKNKVPLDFVSWHIYNKDPQVFRKSIAYMKDLLRKYPSMLIETILDEWNMSIGRYRRNLAFQPCFVAEVTYQMVEGGLDYGCYYHIRDGYVTPEVMSFLPWWNPADWNRISLELGIFDFQNVIRPTYFLFRLMSRLAGERVKLETTDSAVHGLAAYDSTLEVYSLLLWNFSESAARAGLTFEGAPSDLTAHRVVLDAETPSNEEFARLRQEEPINLTHAGGMRASIDLQPYQVIFWALTKAA